MYFKAFFDPFATSKLINDLSVKWKKLMILPPLADTN